MPRAKRNSKKIKKDLKTLSSALAPGQKKLSFLILPPENDHGEGLVVEVESSSSSGVNVETTTASCSKSGNNDVVNSSDT